MKERFCAARHSRVSMSADAARTQCLRMTLMAFVVDCDLQGFEEFLILRGQFDLARRLKLALDRWLGIVSNISVIRLFGRVVALVESDGCLQDEEHIVTGPFDFTDGSGNAIGIGERFIYRVP